MNLTLYALTLYALTLYYLTLYEPTLMLLMDEKQSLLHKNVHFNLFPLQSTTQKISESCHNK